MNLSEAHELFLQDRDKRIRMMQECSHEEMDVIGWTYGGYYDELDISREDIYECKKCGKIEYY